jgi:hypothetical protein
MSFEFVGMTVLPNANRAILDLRKLESYCLNPAHPRGWHKARVFREALGIDRTSASWLRQFLLEAVLSGGAVELAPDAMGRRATRKASCGKNNLDRENGRGIAEIRHLLGAAIAMLGLVELKPLVEQAFARGLISDAWLSFRHFEEDLQEAIADRAGLFVRSDEFTLFGDTIQELSDWDCFRPKAPKTPERGNTLWRGLTDSPATNPFKNIGRNDPCPCGSGIKFKKCCLAVGPTVLAM